MSEVIKESAETSTHSASGQELTLVDCDVHPVFAEHWVQELLPFVPIEWQRKFGAVERYIGLPGVWLPANGLYPRSASPVRQDLIGPDGSLPGIDPERSAADLLDPYGIDRAVLIPQVVFGVGAMPNTEAASVIASATNDWMINKWFAADSRWRGCITVAAQDPVEAAAEVERRAADRRFVGVFISLGNILMGEDHFYPIYEVAQRHRLAITLHVTGTEGLLETAPQLAGGIPHYHFEFRMNIGHPYYANLASLVAHGVFERFPDLKVAFTEIGFAWLPELLWRMDSFWKASREDTPWLKRRPSEYVFDNCRFTSQPFIEPGRQQHISQILEMIHAERTLMFSTDFPHWDFDDPLRVSREIPDSMRQAIMVGNALDTYGDRLL